MQRNKAGYMPLLQAGKTKDFSIRRNKAVFPNFFAGRLKESEEVALGSHYLWQFCRVNS